jgi:hypothetical protein
MRDYRMKPAICEYFKFTHSPPAYEVQISDDKGKDPSKGLFGGIYGFLTPSEMAAKDADEWQTYDITLIGRMVTVVANGKTIVSKSGNSRHYRRCS